MEPLAAPEGTRVYVVCSKFTDVASLRSVFEQQGEVEEVKLLRDNDGNSRGCAFITFQERAAAEAAVMKCNGMQLTGRTMKVMMAERRRPPSQARATSSA